jgi:hypothetical protein
MTPKEKASELIEKNYQTIHDLVDVNNAYFYSKELALICVNEILNSIDCDILSLSASLSRKYFELVKDELNKL